MNFHPFAYFIHPRFLSQSGAMFPSSGTIQAPTETRDPVSGQITQTWTDQPGLTNIACRIETLSGGETRAITQVFATATHTVWFDGYYPQITAKMRLIADGIVYNILLPNNDAFGSFTNLVVEVRQ